jgi:hypothetical protein
MEIAMRTILIAFLLAGTTFLNGQSPTVKPASAKHVHRIFVDNLHFPSNPDWDGFVRAKLISSLVQDCGSNCAVLEENGDTGEDTADSVLTGTILVQSPDERHVRVQGAMRLVDRDGTVIWAATVYSSPFARSASSSFADNIAKKLSAFLAQGK